MISNIFVEGGWGSWSVLLFGMITLGAAVRFALKPETTQLRFLGSMAVTTVVTTIHAVWMNVGVVFSVLEDTAKVPDEQFTRILMAGLKESGRPGTIAGVLLTLACLLVSVGFLRADRRASA